MYYKKVSIDDELPEMGKFVTTIDTAGEHRVYRRTEHGWNMRDADGTNSPNNNLPITHWLKEVSEVPVQLFDHYASQAMNAIMQNKDFMDAAHLIENENVTMQEAIAIMAMVQAEAMIKFRNKNF